VVHEHIYDVFISYASEDRRSIAQPIARELIRRGLRVWYDDNALLVGDDLLKVIGRGLEGARYGVVILSQDFFLKNWPRYELNALLAKETIRKSILPILHRISAKEMARHAPALANKRAVSTTEGLDRICDEIVKVVRLNS
jgi:hypothetical protein